MGKATFLARKERGVEGAIPGRTDGLLYRAGLLLAALAAAGLLLAGLVGRAEAQIAPTDACDDTQGGCANVAFWKPAQNPKTGEFDIMLNDFKGAYASFVFKGTSVKWVTAKSGAGGKTAVFLDGNKVKTFDAYNRSVLLNQVG